MAKLAGGKVITVTSTANLDLVRSLGAEIAIDYTADFLICEKRYDIIIDVVAASSFNRCKHKFADNG